MIAEAPRRALAGLHLLPPLNECEAVETEQWINLDTRRIVANIEPIRINGKIDLRVRRSGVWYVFDHKSTKGKSGKGGEWAYVKTPEQLFSDPQAIFYGLDTVYKHNLEGIWSRWVYYLTDPQRHPDATAVDVHFTKDHLEAEAYKWLVTAVEMRNIVREAKRGTLNVDDIPPPVNLPPHQDSPCLAFGGCPYRAERGGPCRAGSTLNFGALLLGNLQDEKEMNLTEKLASMKSTPASPQAAVQQAPLTPPTVNIAVGGVAPATVSPNVLAAVPQSPLLPPEAYQMPTQTPPTTVQATQTQPLQQAAITAPVVEKKRGRPKKEKPEPEATPVVIDTVGVSIRDTENLPEKSADPESKGFVPKAGERFEVRVCVCTEQGYMDVVVDDPELARMLVDMATATFGAK